MSVSCERTPWTQSVQSQFARAVEVWLRDTAQLSFTHRALLRLVTQCSLEDRQMGSGAFRIIFFSSIEDRYMGVGWGGGGKAFRIQSVTDRGPNVVNGYKLQFLTPTMKHQSLFAYLMHVSQGSQMHNLKLFFYLSHFASTTEASLLGSNFSTQEMFTPIFLHA